MMLVGSAEVGWGDAAAGWGAGVGGLLWGMLVKKSGWEARSAAIEGGVNLWGCWCAEEEWVWRRREA